MGATTEMEWGQSAKAVKQQKQSNNKKQSNNPAEHALREGRYPDP
jgi:hypothetical protein